MRTLLIRAVLPAAFCCLPLLAGALIAVAIPVGARADYLARVKESPIDLLIIGLGLLLFTSQFTLSWLALQWRGAGFNERPDRWLTHLAQAAEWFPLLGLLGTVAAILQTFNSISPSVTPQEIIRKYAPAITATGSGLFMALVNILPTWTVLMGRDLIGSLAGHPGDGGEP